MRITLIIGTLGGGGAERAVTNMANYWAAKDWPVTILTTNFAGESPCYDLHPAVGCLDLGESRLTNLPRDQFSDQLLESIDGCSEPERAVLISEADLIVKLRGAIIATAPEAVISHLNLINICVLLATQELGLPVIVTEHCDPSLTFMGDGWERLRRRVYPLANYVMALTEESLDYLLSIAGVRGRIVPNGVTPGAYPVPQELPARRDGKILLAMGRLAPEKGFNLLIQAFARIAERNADWTLEILGEGQARSYFEAWIEKLGLENRVLMPGFSCRPFEALRQADLFVLPSEEEGFPNVLLEAMACGRAVVSFDCPSGPRHIVRNGVDGILVPPRDVEAMATALERLMRDEGERRRLGLRASEVIERFGMERVMNAWERLLADCVCPATGHECSTDDVGSRVTALHSQQEYTQARRAVIG